MTRRYPVMLTAASLLILLGGAALMRTTPAIARDRSETLAPLVAQAETGQPPAPGERPNQPPEPPFMEQLNLTTEQQNQIRAMREQSRPQMNSLREQMQQAEEQMRSLMAGNATADQLRQQHQQLQTLRQQADDQMFEDMLAFREILTPQQRTELATLMQQHHEGPGGPPMHQGGPTRQGAPMSPPQ